MVKIPTFKKFHNFSELTYTYKFKLAPLRRQSGLLKFLKIPICQKIKMMFRHVTNLAETAQRKM